MNETNAVDVSLSMNTITSERLKGVTDALLNDCLCRDQSSPENSFYAFSVALDCVGSRDVSRAHIKI